MKEAVDFGDKYLTPKEAKKEEEIHTWVESSSVMMLRTNRSELVNILKNYHEHELKEVDDIKKLQTAEAKFSIDYFKGILKLLTKIKTSDSSEIKIRMGTDSPVTLTIEEGDTFLEVTLAPRVDGQRG